jgi:hypothetical protein
MVVAIAAGCGGGSASKSTTTTAAPAASSASTQSASSAAAAAKGKWTDTAKVNPADPNTTLVVVGCATPTFCVAIDQGQHSYTFDGSSWGAPISTNGLANVNALSCLSPTNCLATDLQGRAATFDGTAWSAPQPVDPSGIGLNSSSCPTPTFCAAVDNSGNAFVSFNGSSWSAAQAIDPAAAAAVDAVNNGSGTDVPTLYLSCPAAGMCVSVDSLGNTMTFVNGSWSAAAPIASGTHKLFSLSCGAPTSCVSGERGAFFTFDGTRWGPSQSLPPQQGVQVSRISCATSTFCMSASGQWATFDGSKWTPAHPNSRGPTGNDPLALDCPTADFCLAVGAFGGASVYNAR